MHIYTYTSNHDRSESKSPDREPRPIHVWFDKKERVYHAIQVRGMFEVSLSRELGEKTLEKLKLAVDIEGALPESIFESLASDSADLRSCQNNPKFPQVLSAGMKGIRGRDTNKFQYLYLYETANAEQNIEVNFNFATGMFDIQKSDQWNGHSDLYIQGITPEFGTSSVQEVHDILNTLGEVPPEINTWIDDMSNRYPRFEKREDPELERYRMISVMLDKHEKWLKNQEGGKQASFVGMDVSGDHFRGRNLSQVDFTGCDMRGIAGKNLLNFSGAIMPDTNWKGMRISNMKFDDVILDGANFENTCLENTQFSGHLVGTKFTLSTIINSRFDGADMDGATMEDTQISDTMFIYLPVNELTMNGATLTDCYIEKSNISRWNLTGAKIQAVIDLPSFATVENNDKVTELNLSFDGKEISAKGATIITVQMTTNGGAAYIAFLPDKNAFIGTTGYYGPSEFIKNMGYTEESGPNEFIQDVEYTKERKYCETKFMTSVEEVAKELEGYTEIPKHLMVKMQRLLDENTKNLAPAGAKEVLEQTGEHSHGR